MANQPDPRETLNEILKNIHGSLKWFWQVIMGLSMVKAVDSLYGYTFESHPAKYFPLILFLGVFLPTFGRFYFGDSRHLDEHYIEYRRWRPIGIYLQELPKKVSRYRFFMDILLLMVIGIAFVFLAKSLSNVAVFFAVYAALLFFDVIWLFLVTKRDTDQSNARSQGRNTMPKCWMTNNLIHFAMIIVFLVWECYTVKNTGDGSANPQEWLGASLQQWLLVCVCVSNSVFDVAFTKEYYFPTLNASHDKTLRG